jgi:hypothetical protein
MKYMNWIALAGCLTIGPCISINSARTYNVEMRGTQDNTVEVLVEKEETIDGQVSANVTGVGKLK